MNEFVLNSASVNFLEANTNAITLDELTDQCVVPTWANQELTITEISPEYSLEGLMLKPKLQYFGRLM